MECWYCGKKGHRERECWKKRADTDKSGSSKKANMGIDSGRTTPRAPKESEMDWALPL